MSGATQLVFDLPSRAARGRGDFFVSDANALAVRQLDGWRDWPERKLALIGPARSGKTHLTGVWATECGARVISAADLPDWDLAALTEVPALAVEDVDRLALLPETARGEAETALFHLHNAVLQAQGHLLVTGALPPAHWEIGLPDLASRLRATPVARLDPPDDALLMAVLVKLFSDRQLIVDPDLIEYLAVRLDRSFEAAAHVVATLDREALRRRRPVTVRLASEILFKPEPGQQRSQADA
ncbi:P-loop NTPase family protein [Oceanomicrobium pacificus]|uniref:Chromosomal replication initiator DnaA n=1 Tax=Oceanomicrobium pacificus TaxID=2692916 RepID=A0A6B0TWJ6_9RHOB|nr:DnaA/Hda family protein [Oceanomicrobium pacificus]MXU65373.1 chromosomal replication initiator DnaA [Oceanomicrobium pacificus]